MTLVRTARGNGTHNTASASLSVTPGSNFANKSMAVLMAAFDNSGTSGANPFTTVTDSVGNDWVARINQLNDPGVASAGCVLVIATSQMGVRPLTTGDTISVNFSPNVTAKAWVLEEVSTNANETGVAYVTGNSNTLAASNSPTITTSSIPVADIIVCANANEYGTAQTETGDADATNGSWTAAVVAEIGTTTSGMNILSQTKIVTGAATQTFNPTYSGGAATDNSTGWTQFTEVAAPARAVRTYPQLLAH